MSGSAPPQSENSHSKDKLIEALAALNKALDGLESSADAALERSQAVFNADQEVQRMADDRARMALELDGAHARSERLAKTNSEVSRRLVGAMEMVRGVLDKS